MCFFISGGYKVSTTSGNFPTDVSWTLTEQVRNSRKVEVSVTSYQLPYESDDRCGWYVNGEFEYFWDGDNTKTRSAANSACENDDGWLATVGNYNYDFLKTIVTEKSWVGFYDDGNAWDWSEFQALGFTTSHDEWTGGDDGDCTTLDSDGSWGSDSCDNSKTYVCQKALCDGTLFAFEYGDGWKGAEATFSDCVGNVVGNVTMGSEGLALVCLESGSEPRVVNISTIQDLSGVSMALSDSNGYVLVAGAYENISAGELVFESACNCGVLNVIMRDTGGDGWASSVLTISGCDGTELATMTLEEGTYDKKFQCLALTEGLYSNYYKVAVSSDQSPSEVSWTVTNLDGEAETGSADGVSTTCLEFVEGSDGDFEYHVSDISLSWDEAEDFCEYEDGFLLTHGDYNDNFITGLATAESWIGFRDAYDTNDYTWETLPDLGYDSKTTGSCWQYWWGWVGWTPYASWTWMPQRMVCSLGGTWCSGWCGWGAWNWNWWWSYRWNCWNNCGGFSDHWDSNPSTYNGERCVTIDYYGGWDEANCDLEKKFVCQRPACDGTLLLLDIDVGTSSWWFDVTGNFTNCRGEEIEQIAMTSDDIEFFCAPDSYEFTVHDDSIYTTYSYFLDWTLKTVEGDVMTSSSLYHRRRNAYDYSTCWETSGYFEYLTTDWNMTWSDAQSWCDRNDGWLVTVGEFNFDEVKAMMTEDVWIGYSFQDGVGLDRWGWDGMSALGINESSQGEWPWSPGEPSESTDGMCAFWSTVGFWNASDCDANKAFICQRSVCSGDIFAFHMFDDAGDGWEGAVATIEDCDGSDLKTVTLSDGLSSYVTPLCLTDTNDRYKAVVSEDSYSDEVSWKMFVGDGDELMSGGDNTEESSCWKLAGGFEYYVSTGKRTCDSAKSACSNMDSYLATVGEYNWDDLVDLMTDGTDYLIGYSILRRRRYYQTQDWEWAELSSFGYEYSGTQGEDPWKSGRPYYASGSSWSWWAGWTSWSGIPPGHDCVYMDDGHGEWEFDNYDSSWWYTWWSWAKRNFICQRSGCDGDLMMFVMSDSQGDGWNGAVTRILDCDGNVLEGYGMWEGSKNIEMMCLPGNFGRFQVGVSGGANAHEVSWELMHATEDWSRNAQTDLSGGSPALESSCDLCQVLTITMDDQNSDGWQGSTLTIFNCDAEEVATVSVDAQDDIEESLCLEVSDGYRVEVDAGATYPYLVEWTISSENDIRLGINPVNLTGDGDYENWTCALIWRPHGTFEYLRVDWEETWRGAKDWCQSKGGWLTTVGDYNFDFVKDLLTTNTWIGYSDIGQWEWQGNGGLGYTQTDMFGTSSLYYDC